MPLRYVILHHGGIPDPHFDLMFETRPGSDLATWRSHAWPIEEPTPLTRLKDHRRLYLTYEGELPGQRGQVQQTARGDCEVEVGENAVWTVRILTGATPCTLVLRRINGDQWEASAA